MGALDSHLVAVGYNPNIYIHSSDPVPAVSATSAAPPPPPVAPNCNADAAPDETTNLAFMPGFYINNGRGGFQRDFLTPISPLFSDANIAADAMPEINGHAFGDVNHDGKVCHHGLELLKRRGLHGWC